MANGKLVVGLHLRAQLNLGQGNDQPDHQQAAADSVQQEDQDTRAVEDNLQANRDEGEDHRHDDRTVRNCVLIGVGEEARCLTAGGHRVDQARGGVNLSVECGQQRQNDNGLHEANRTWNVRLL